MSSSDHPDASVRRARPYLASRDPLLRADSTLFASFGRLQEEIAGMNREMMRLQGENHELSSKAVRLEREVNNLELVATEKATLEAKLAEAEAEKDALKAAHEAVSSSATARTSMCGTR